MSALTPDDLVRISQQLDDLALQIADFPRYIRRDTGSKSNRQVVLELLEKHELEDNDELLEDILALTEKLRLTIRNYYEKRFFDGDL